MNKSLFHNFFSYSISSLLCRGLTFLVAPLTIGFLTPSEFGLLSLTNSFIVIMTIVVGCGLRNSMSLEYFHYAQDKRKELLTHIIASYFLLAVPLCGFLFLNNGLINTYYFCSQSFPLLILISLSICFFTFLIEFYQQYLQYNTKIYLAIKLQLAAALSTVLCTVLFLTIFQLNVTGIISAQLIGMLFVYGLPFFNIARTNVPTVSSLKQTTKKMTYFLKIGLPFVPGLLCNWIMASGDRWFLANYADLHAVGIYTIADAFGSLFHIIVSNSITAVYLPHLMRQFSQHKNSIQTIERYNKKIMIMSMAGAFVAVTGGFLLIKPLLLLILPIAYQESLAYVWFTFLGYILLMGTYFCNIFIQYRKKGYFLAGALVVPALLNAALNRILIPHFAIYGCITATVTAYLLYFCITLVYNLKLQKQFIPALQTDEKEKMVKKNKGVRITRPFENTQD